MAKLGGSSQTRWRSAAGSLVFLIALGAVLSWTGIATAAVATRPANSTGHARGCGFSTRAFTNYPHGRSIGRCTVLEIGDSLGNDLGWGIERHLASSSGLTMIQMDKSSSGLANSWFYSWPVHLATMLRQFHPQLLIVSLGGNDEQGMKIRGSAVPFGSAEWRSIYLSYVREIAHQAVTAGAYVLWVGMPIMGYSPSYDQGMALLDSLYQRGVASVPGATFLSTSSLFANHGRFQSTAAVNGVTTVLREPDGIHYSESGEDVVATYVIRAIASTYHVALSPLDPATITSW